MSKATIVLSLALLSSVSTGATAECISSGPMPFDCEVPALVDAAGKVPVVFRGDTVSVCSDNYSPVKTIVEIRVNGTTVGISYGCKLGRLNHSNAFLVFERSRSTPWRLVEFSWVQNGRSTLYLLAHVRTSTCNMRRQVSEPSEASASAQNPTLDAPTRGE